MVCPPPLLIFRLACCGTGFNSCSVFFSSAIVSIPHSVGANQAWSPGKRKTDLKRSVSLLAPRHPSDHLQVTVQRLPESPVSTLSVWLRLLCSISRRGPSESLVCSSLGGAGGHVGGMQCEVPDRLRHLRPAWRRPHLGIAVAGCGRRLLRPTAVWFRGSMRVAAEPGIEPGLRDPNSPVLPLHHSARCARRSREWFDYSR
jgi:hypothetical protein